MKRFYAIFSALLFVGAVNAQTSFINEDFEGGALPSNWDIVSNATDGGFTFGTPAGLSSNSFPIPDESTGSITGTNDDACNCDKGDEYLMTPSMDFTNIGGAFFEADIFYIAGSYQGISEDANLVYSTDGGTSWNNLMNLAGSTDGWQHITADLSSLAGNNDVIVAFHYTDNGGWLYGLAIDNVSIYEPLGTNVAVSALNLTRFGAVSDNVTVSGTLTNKGSNVVDDVKITWTDGTNTHEETLTQLGLNPLESMEFTHGDNFSIPAIGDHSINVSAAEPNGMTDEDMSDNSMDATVTGLSFVPTRNVVIEEATGTWCGWCPRGTVGLAYMEENYPNTAIGIAVHNGDPMVVAEYDNNIDVGGYPSSHVDRFFLDTDPNSANLEDLHNQRIAMTPMAEVTNEYTFNTETRLLNITVKAKFAAALTGADMRFNAVIVQDNVTGTESGYAQANYYSFQSSNLALVGAGKDWQQEPNPVPAEDMVYDHVARDILGGWAGMPNSVPSAVAVDEEVTATFLYTVPADAWLGDFSIVGMLIDQTTGEIVNAKKTHVDYDATSLNEVDNLMRFSVYPNPSTEGVTFVRVDLDAASNVQLRVNNVLGQEVFNQSFSNMSGSQVLPFQNDGLESGMYLFTLTVDGQTHTERVMIR